MASHRVEREGNAAERASDPCWLRYERIAETLAEQYRYLCGKLVVLGGSPILDSAREELVAGISSMLGLSPVLSKDCRESPSLVLASDSEARRWVDQRLWQQLDEEGYVLKTVDREGGSTLLLLGKTDQGALYAAFHLLRLMQTGRPIHSLSIVENPKNRLRMINHWDNLDGSVERGYAGGSIFYQKGRITRRLDRIRDYARLLASVGINAIAINNVNVDPEACRLITGSRLPDVARLADVFRSYGIRTYLSVNFASPLWIGGLPTADPLDPAVQRWWRERVEAIYRHIPDFGGFVVKADSEHQPGPFTYNRTHAEGANLLAEALRPYGGLVIWRCFVYSFQDWRDRSTDRARAAYDHFKPLDGRFHDNVVLQIKNGPMDFQVREPVSPLFGAMERTNQMLELQITQEYTGQQKDLCFLVPQWKEVLDFDTYAKGKGSTVKAVVGGEIFPYRYSGIVGVSNVGNDPNWTGHTLAQANWYGFGRLSWNPDLSAEEIAEEWVRLTFGHDPQVVETICGLLLESWSVYESYTAPLGIGWMVKPGHHYGPDVDGYEYSYWGTYHYADHKGIGVDRTMKTGTGFTGQYFSPNRETYESLETCPDELLLFFHHVPYTHRLKSGITVIQHIYDTHFEGVERVEDFIRRWSRLKGRIDRERYEHVLKKFREQRENAREWRDVINAYFFRKSGIPDEKNRPIY
ncbi:MAG: alpha-glucuronidase family glycosyl hydrolase [Planifilum sp.]|jgi:alpha-glucuronidase